MSIQDVLLYSKGLGCHSLKKEEKNVGELGRICLLLVNIVNPRR